MIMVVVYHRKLEINMENTFSASQSKADITSMRKASYTSL